MADVVSLHSVRIVGDADPSGRKIVDLLDPVAGVDFGVARTFIAGVCGWC